MAALLGLLGTAATAAAGAAGSAKNTYEDSPMQDAVEMGSAFKRGSDAAKANYPQQQGQHMGGGQVYPASPSHGQNYANMAPGTYITQQQPPAHWSSQGQQMGSGQYGQPGQYGPQYGGGYPTQQQPQPMRNGMMHGAPMMHGGHGMPMQQPPPAVYNVTHVHAGCKHEWDSDYTCCGRFMCIILFPLTIINCILCCGKNACEHKRCKQCKLRG